MKWEDELSSMRANDEMLSCVMTVEKRDGVDKSRHTHTQMRCDTQQEERHIILMSDTLMPSAGLLFPKASEGVSNLIIVVCRIS